MSWFLAFAGFAALIILHELGHFVAAKAVGMRVERFMLFFPPIAASVKRGETEYGVGVIPLGGYVKITGMNPAEEIPPEHQHRAYYKQPVWKRVVVIFAGPLVNVIVAFLILGGLYFFQGPAVGTDRVADISPNSAAVGVLRPGDRLVSVDGVRGTPERLRAQIATHKCAGTPVEGCRATTPATLVVQREGAQQTLSITPRYSVEAERALVGFAFDYETQPQGFIESAGSSVDNMWTITTLTVKGIVKIFYDSEARKEVSGPVGSYETTRQTIQEFGFVQALNILAIISLSLAIINLFPFLPLDGGHIFWAVAEKLRGRAISFRVMERASVIGFALVAVLFIVGLTNDIGRIQGEGFGVR